MTVGWCLVTSIQRGFSLVDYLVHVLYNLPACAGTFSATISSPHSTNINWMNRNCHKGGITKQHQLHCYRFQFVGRVAATKKDPKIFDYLPVSCCLHSIYRAYYAIKCQQ